MFGQPELLLANEQKAEVLFVTPLLRQAAVGGSYLAVMFPLALQGSMRPQDGASVEGGDACEFQRIQATP